MTRVPARFAAAVAAIAAGLVVSASCFLTISRFENDHFFNISRGRQVLFGAWPVRDFIDPGMPLTYLLSAGAAAIGGPTFLSEAILCIALIASGTAIALWLVDRVTGSVWLGIAAAAATLAVPTRLYSATKVACVVVAMWLGARAARKPDTGRIAVLGVWTGVAFLLRIDYAVYIGLASVVMLALDPDSWRLRARAVGLYAGCALVVAVPWLVYVQLEQGLPEYVGSAIRFAEAERARTVTGVPSFTLPLWQAVNSGPALFFGFVAVPCAALLLAVRTPDPIVRRQLLFLATLTLLCDLGFLRDVVVSRIGDVIAATAILAATIASVIVPRRALTPLAVAVSLLLLTYSTAAYARRDGRLAPAQMVAQWATNVNALSRSDAEAAPSGPLPDIAAYLARCTLPGERVIVSGFAPEIPVLAARPFAGGLPTWLLGYYVTPPDQRIIERHVSRERIGAVVLLEGTYVFTVSWPSIAERLKASGMEEYSLSTARPEYRIWVRSDGRSSQPDTATGLPCRRA